jgi:plastocyanin
MRKLVGFGLFLAVSSAAPAQPVAVSIELSNFKFAPNPIQLRAGAPITLHLQNTASGGHSFSAPAFFAAARIEPRSAALVHDGMVDVPANRAVDVALVPAAGSYKLKCTHTFHSTFGMKGTIVVR